MKVRHTLIAAALALATTPAFAAGDDADLYTNWDMMNSIFITGDVFTSGTVDIDSTSSALVDQDQATVANLSFGDGDNSAGAWDDALSDAEGNIGANIAAGVGNAQANDAALSAIDGDRVFASAEVFNSQTTTAAIATDFPSGPDNQHFFDASVSDNVLADAAGNIGLNVAAGNGNAQSNALSASVNTSGNAAVASADSEQLTFLNVLVALEDLDNSASLSGSALSGAVGNIGVNVAAGLGNAQHNGLALSVATGD